MSKFGLDETDVTRIVGKELQSLKTAVQENNDNIANMNNQTGWDRALGSSLRRLNQEIINLKAKVEILEARINSP
jgi:hypothetical protein